MTVEIYLNDTLSIDGDDTEYMGSWIDGHISLSLWLNLVVEFAIDVTGFFLNCLVIDNSFGLPVTGGSIWMRYLAIWENAFLCLSAFSNGLIFTGINLATQSNVLCKLYKYFWWVFAVNSHSHLACLAVDRVVCVSFTAWHHKKEWKGKIRNISGILTVLHILILYPTSVHFYQVKDGACRMASENKAVKTTYVALLAIGLALTYSMVITISSLKLATYLCKRQIASNQLPVENRSRKIIGLPDKLAVKVEVSTSTLSPEDQKALWTIVMACIWYTICLCVSAAGFLVTEHAAVSVKERLSLLIMSRWIGALGHSLNFVIYMRGKTFAQVFKSKWAVRCRLLKP